MMLLKAERRNWVKVKAEEVVVMVLMEMRVGSLF